MLARRHAGILHAHTLLAAIIERTFFFFGGIPQIEGSLAFFTTGSFEAEAGAAVADLAGLARGGLLWLLGENGSTKAGYQQPGEGNRTAHNSSFTENAGSAQHDTHEG